MKKLIIGIVIVVAAAAAIGTAAYISTQVSAQTLGQETPEPGDDNNYGYGSGHGTMGGRRGGMRMMDGDENGIMHDAMLSAFSEKLGISVEDLETRLDNGESMADIATSEGLTQDEFFSLMSDARQQAIDQAVADGTLTQEQGDWMQQRGGGRGMHGGAEGEYGSPDCPNNQAAP